MRGTSLTLRWPQWGPLQQASCRGSPIRCDNLEAWDTAWQWAPNVLCPEVQVIPLPETTPNWQLWQNSKKFAQLHKLSYLLTVEDFVIPTSSKCFSIKSMGRISIGFNRKLSVVGCCCSREERAGDKKMGKFTPGKRRDGACNSFLSRTEDLMESMD